ncbi:hypothetical protein PILCRDRAFT_941 [Piloderma croceum F 1598]|uniref:Uncharacterized protein n=1 Tax=Piloderma croceum (strain F 1598) TaxID=765440 RepID=A0A0C3CLX6_PILCF|nr:hypothetical protein PILCRDRAFT_941 [Piloderma croceum F 1598]
MLQAILDDAVNVSEQTKAVLDRLVCAKQFLQMIMELGVIACELRPIAKAVFDCVNIVYKEQIDELTNGFNRFKQQFDRGISVQTATGTLEMLLEQIESTKDDKWLG